MTLRRRLMITFYSAALLAVIGAIAAIHYIVTPAYFDMEEDSARGEVARVEAAFMQTLTILHARSRDWAERPEVQALAGGDDSVMPQPPGANSLSGPGVDQVVVINQEGGQHWLLAGGSPDQAALAALYAWAPVAFKLAAIAVMWRYPITAARQRRLRGEVLRGEPLPRSVLGRGHAPDAPHIPVQAIGAYRRRHGDAGVFREIRHDCKPRSRRMRRTQRTIICRRLALSSANACCLRSIRACSLARRRSSESLVNAVQGAPH